MAPPKKKEKQEKMSLSDFMSEPKYGGNKSWADEVEDTYGMASQPLPPLDRKMGSSSYTSYTDRGYSVREQAPQTFPDKPPYTAHLGNLSYDATQESVTDFFSGCDVVSIRIIEDKIEQRPKGFAYAEFGNPDGLKKALALDGTSFEGRTIKIKIADPPKDRDNNRYGDSSRDLGDWTRKGPLPDLPSRGGPRDRDRDNGERRVSEFNSDRRGSREPSSAAPSDDKPRDFNNWERKGPLSPIPQQDRAPQQGPGSRDGSRPRTNDRNDSFRNNNQNKDRRSSPASWGEGRQQQPGQGQGQGGSQGQGPDGGSRPPRREFVDRPERVPSAADRDMMWRSNMRPDAPPSVAKSPVQSRDGSEAPPSPAPGPSPALAPAGRPKLNLQKRTISEAPTDLASPSATGENKSNPFGAARPIDTAARERAVEEKRQQAIREKKEADEKAKEDRRLAKEQAAKDAKEQKEQAAKEAAEKAEATDDAESTVPEVVEPVEEAEPAAEVEAEPAAKETIEDSITVTDQKTIPTRPREPREPREQREQREQREPREPREPRENVANYKSRAAESGNWRNASSDHPGGGGRGEYRGGRGGGRGGRGGRDGGPAPEGDVPSGPRRGSGAPRGPRHDGEGGGRGGRGGHRSNGGPPPAVQQPAPPQQQGQGSSAAAAEGAAPDTPSTPTVDAEGWTTVPNKARRGGGRPLATA